jgi:hypothetical protein
MTGNRSSPFMRYGRVLASLLFASCERAPSFDVQGSFFPAWLHRIELLLEKQLVTVDQADRARTSEIAQAEALKQAASQRELSQAGLKSALPQYEHSEAVLESAVVVIRGH